MVTIYTKLIAKQEGLYTTYVFNDLNRELSDNQKFIMCVKLPNWDSTIINIGDIGFVLLDFVVAGKSSWYNCETKDNEFYKHSNCYFIKFIKEEKINNKTEFKF